jgi:hypothetical protein
MVIPLILQSEPQFPESRKWKAAKTDQEGQGDPAGSAASKNVD